jgi:hypothetical protein
VIEQIEPSLVFFFLSNGSFGVYDTDHQQVFTCRLDEKSEPKDQLVSLRRVNESGATQEEKIQFSTCPHRVLLSIKQK